MYPEELVSPMKKQLTDQGFSELKTEEDVNKMINNSGTTLVVVNSVCGCAAANARPGAITSLVNDKKPDHLTTVFAGVDREATEKVRYYLAPFPPSSPAIALFKNGELVHMLERHHIEGRAAEMISQNLKLAYNEFC
ncbi:MAG: hypothetical protein CMC36_06175 [Flavobacteriaceae bacterium]|nr:hypothetical protein [Flavobacteriaceae bacterium]|tara:strand:- start:10405 stop:10815 length:411 start_codon:yes stop_codon:yes gene_type:complete